MSIKYKDEYHSLNADINIPKIAKKQVYTTDWLKFIPLTDGTAWIDLRIKSSNGKKINYYQVSKANNQNILLGDNIWKDYFHVASHQEVHQRYTNYILLVLTSLTVLLFIINLKILLDGG